MISFNLACKDGHEFEGWFRSSDAFEAQARDQRVDCPVCGDTHIVKAPMAPAVTAKSVSKQAAAERARELRKALVAMRDHVEKNFDYVGNEFADEARKIYHGETDERAIYGETTDSEANDLKDEGVPVSRMPWVRRDDS